MDIETSIVQAAFKKQGPLFNKGEIPFKTEIRNGIIDQQQAEPGYRYPEHHLEKDLCRLLEGGDSCVRHTVGCA